MQFNPYPIEPWLRKQESEQRPDFNKTVTQPLMQGLEYYMQSKQQAKQGELQDLQMKIAQAEYDQKYGQPKVDVNKLLYPDNPTYPTDAPMRTNPMESQKPSGKIIDAFYNHRNLNKTFGYEDNNQAVPSFGGVKGNPRGVANWENAYAGTLNNPEINQRVGEGYKMFGKMEGMTPYQEQMLELSKQRLGSQSGQSGIPKPPPGYRYTADGQSLEPIPGGPAETKQNFKDASLQSTLELYETAREGLLNSLENTTTGPILGRVPAFTANQQSAEGGVAAMAPVLKQLFRVAGEGVFTDRDQALLLAMIPTRSIRKEARQTMIDNIDSIVKAKLGIKKNVDGGENQTTGEVVVNSIEEANALPVGTRFNLKGRKGTVQ